jgi:AcrR family transcriptional regulator
MAYDSAATKARLLDAASAEFTARGFAGARVDRIAAESGANKQAIYAYFGSKEALFDAVLDTRIGILADAVPFTADDLPAYIGALFDHLIGDPALVRLTQWKVLERPDASAAELDSHRAKATALAETLDVGTERGMDILMLALAMAQAWNTTAPPIRGGENPDARLAQHREALILAVEAAAQTLSSAPDRR